METLHRGWIPLIGITSFKSLSLLLLTSAIVSHLVCSCPLVLEHLTTFANASSLPQTPQPPFICYLPVYPRPMTSSCMGLNTSSSVRVVSQLLSLPSTRHPSLCTQCSPAPSLSSCQLPSPSTIHPVLFLPYVLNLSKPIFFYNFFF